MQKKSVFITGLAGTGKTTLSTTLRSLGHESYDLESIPGLFTMYHKGTRDEFVGFTNNHPEWHAIAEWHCHLHLLRELIDEQKNPVAFYCGISSNLHEIFPFFDQLIALKIRPDILREHLSKREGTEMLGGIEEGRRIVLSWKDGFDKDMTIQGALIINANGTTDEVANQVLVASK